MDRQKLNQTDASGAYIRIGFVPWLEQGWGYTWGYEENKEDLNIS